MLMLVTHSSPAEDINLLHGAMFHSIERLRVGVIAAGAPVGAPVDCGTNAGGKASN